MPSKHKASGGQHFWTKHGSIAGMHTMPCQWLIPRLVRPKLMNAICKTVLISCAAPWNRGMLWPIVRMGRHARFVWVCVLLALLLHWGCFGKALRFAGIVLRLPGIRLEIHLRWCWRCWGSFGGCFRVATRLFPFCFEVAQGLLWSFCALVSKLFFKKFCRPSTGHVLLQGPLHWYVRTYVRT